MEKNTLWKKGMDDHDYKRRHLFWKYPYGIRKRIMMDKVAMYSVTPCKFSEMISRIMLDFAPSTSTVVDAFACVGGDSVELARKFHRVIAVERDAERYAMLRHNIDLLAPRLGVHTHCGDFLEWWDSKPDVMGSVGAVYLDPPWEDGCCVNGKPIWSVAAHLRQSLCKGSVIVLKLPPDFAVLPREATRASSLLCNSRGTPKIKIVVI